MAAAKGVVKHVVLAKFKDDVSPEKVEQIIKDFANLVSLTGRMKSFHWGKNVSIENRHQGFTHVFESTFESVEAIAEYLPHPAHVEFTKEFVPALEKVLVIDYEPAIVHQ